MAPPSTSQGNMAAAGGILNSNVPHPQHLNVSGNLASQWKKWKQIWDSYEIVTGLNQKDTAYRVATFITCIGPDAIEIYNGLAFENEGDNQDIEKVIELFNKHCVGEQNVIYERYIFNNRAQEQGETFDSFVSSLRTLAISCDYGNLRDDLIRDRIVNGCSDNGLRKHLLQEAKLTLKTAIDKGRAAESSHRQFKAMTAENNEVKALRRHATPKPGARSAKRISCKYCGQSHARDKMQCPAYGKTCTHCGKKNHFEDMCRAKQKQHAKAGSKPRAKSMSLRQCEDTSDDSCSDYEYVETVTEHVNNMDTSKLSKVYAQMKLCGKLVKFQIDTGATCNVVNKKVVPAKCKIEHTTTRLKMYNNTPMAAVGKTRIPMVNPAIKPNTWFHAS